MPVHSSLGDLERLCLKQQQQQQQKQKQQKKKERKKEREKKIFNLGPVEPSEIVCKCPVFMHFSNQRAQSFYQMLIPEVVFYTVKLLLHVCTNFHCFTELQRMLQKC